VNRRRTGGDGKRKRQAPARPQTGKPDGKRTPRPRRTASGKAPENDFKVVERRADWLDAPAAGTEPERAETPGPFRILIAVHRPRFRGRAQRAADLVGWDVTALLNKQDPVGQVARPPRPPDLLVLSGDFGRQKDYAIFRAVQAWRARGMKLIGLVDDCETAPEGHPDSAPEQLCDVCLPPPYKASELRALFTRLYEEMRGKPAPPPRSAADEEDEA